MPDPAAARPKLRLALALSLSLLVLRLHLAGKVGFGDAEALYVSYALHPQPGYLDHPGFVGALVRFVWNGAVPEPGALHQATALASTIVPWLGYAAARMAGAAPARALTSFFALCLWPELSIGLFALTPDLPLAALWIVAIGAAAGSLQSAPGERGALFLPLLSGLCAGLAVMSKASGALLVLSLVVAFGSGPARARLRTIAPWLGLALVVVLVAPLVTWEAREGFPLLRHRFVATQARAEFSLRNLGALVGGQLLYVTPPLLLGGFRVLRALAEHRKDPVDRLLLVATVVPFVPLAALCLWSRVAEPHWLAPAYVALALGAARHDAGGPRLAWATFAVGALAVLAGFSVAATPIVATVSGKRYVPKYDLTNDLYAWKMGIPLVQEELASVLSQSGDPVVVGPHWTICAQLHAGLGASIRVGCRTPIGDDFSRWYPEREWSRAPTLLFVTDDRFDVPAKTAFPDRDVVGVRTGYVYRGGRSVRAIHVARLERRAVILRP